MRARGFTLIDTMITIVIIAILAAMALPHFTDMSTKAGETSIESQLKTVRGQIELHNYEHPNSPFNPLVPGGVAAWNQLTTNGYLKIAPRNSLQNGSTTVAAAPAAGVGWVWADPVSTGHNIYGVNAAGGYYDGDGNGDPD
jgi:prepilin-type N-terminal cleavage/methylation domain-containing protein